MKASRRSRWWGILFGFLATAAAINGLLLYSCIASEGAEIPAEERHATHDKTACMGIGLPTFVVLALGMAAVNAKLLRIQKDEEAPK